MAGQRSKRAVGVIIQNNKILLMRRVRNGKEYYVFPGGGVEKSEGVKDAVKREIREEMNLGVKLDKLLFRIINQGREEFYYLSTNFSGVPKLGGEEKERMSAKNQYYPVWVKLEEISRMKNLYPNKAKQKITKIFN